MEIKTGINDKLGYGNGKEDTRSMSESDALLCYSSHRPVRRRGHGHVAREFGRVRSQLRCQDVTLLHKKSNNLLYTTLCTKVVRSFLFDIQGVFWA